MLQKSLVVLLLVLFITGCGAVTPITPTSADIETVYTQAAQTLAIQLTLNAGQEAVRKLTEIAKYTPTPPPPTHIPTEPPPTQTSEPATRTPTPTLPPDPLCNRAGFIEDVTIKPGATVLPGAGFKKTWRIQNTGTCTWTPEYALVFFDGNALGGPEQVLIGDMVRPGDLLDISVNLIAPQVEADYSGNWMLRTPTGDLFGAGPQGIESLLVDIRVRTPSEIAFNFSFNYCSAFWSTSAGAISCPGMDENGELGFVEQYDNPVLETGRSDEDPAIIMYPSRGPGGFISGEYPAFRVKQGDHFRTVIGCFFDSVACDVVFQLNYSVDGGPVKNLDSWVEDYDGHVTRVDIDLSSLAGKTVEFILTVLNNGNSADDWAFWLMPVILR